MSNSQIGQVVRESSQQNRDSFLVKMRPFAMEMVVGHEEWVERCSVKTRGKLRYCIDTVHGIIR